MMTKTRITASERMTLILGMIKERNNRLYQIDEKQTRKAITKYEKDEKEKRKELTKTKSNYKKTVKQKQQQQRRKTITATTTKD